MPNVRNFPKDPRLTWGAAGLGWAAAQRFLMGLMDQIVCAETVVVDAAAAFNSVVRPQWKYVDEGLKGLRRV